MNEQYGYDSRTSSSAARLCRFACKELEVTKEDIEPVIIMGLYHHRDLIGSPGAFIKANNDILP